MENKIEKELSVKIYFLNFFFTICILIHHSNINGVYQINNEVVSNILKFIGNIGILAMPFFFFTSGFLFFYNYDKKNGRKKIISRIKSLLIPYIIWNIIAIIFLQLNIDVGVKQIIKYFVLYKQNAPANSVLWYIFRLLTYIIISPIICKFLKNKKMFLLIILFLNLFNFCFDINYLDFLYWLPTYMLGAYTGKNQLVYFNNLAKKEEKNYLIFFVVLFVYCTLFTFTLSSRVVYLLRSIGIIIFYLGIKYIDIRKINNYFIKVPFFIYCIHGIIVSNVRKYFVNNIIINNEFTYIFIYFLVAIISFIMINILYFFLNKYFKLILQILTGNRSERKS